VLPGGLGQVVYSVRDRLLRMVADRRGIVVPSLVADKRQVRAGPAEDDLLAALAAAKGPADLVGPDDPVWEEARR